MGAGGVQRDDAAVEVLEQALGSVPAYRAWRALDPGSRYRVDERFAALPALTKADMRRHGVRAFHLPWLDLDRAVQSCEVELVWTSGTTEERIQNVWYQPWWDESERQSWALNVHARGLGGHREAILTGPRQAGKLCCHGTLSMAERTEGRFLFLNEQVSPELWTPELMERMLRELNEFQPRVLEANPSFLAKLARYVTATGRCIRGPQLIVLTYENPSLLHRRAIARAFEAPMASSYGSTEAGYVFMECEAGRMHQVAGSCRVDFQPLRPEHGGPDVGRILVTTYNNPWRVLVRFDIGDLVRVCRTPCVCGRNDGLTLEAIEGRTDTITYAQDGRAVTAASVDRTLSVIEGLAEYQLTQRTAVDFEIVAVPEESHSGAHVKRQVHEALTWLYGSDIHLDIQLAPSFPPESSGKFRLVRAGHGGDLHRLFEPLPQAV